MHDFVLLLQYRQLMDLFEEGSKYELDETLSQYCKDHVKYGCKADDSVFKSTSVGRRKTAFAEVHVSLGNGNIVINSKTLLEYFPRIEDRQQVLFPFNTIDSDKFNVSVKVYGGGQTGNILVITVYVII